MQRLIIARRVTAVKQNTHTVTIETPEHVELQFLLAGIGTRFLAYLVDRTIQLGLIAWMIVAGLAVFGFFGAGEPLADLLTLMRGALGQWLIALAILAYGVTTIGYFILFEYIWSGRTPGKRSQQIRVIRNDGRPISFFDSAVRNILRFADIVASIYPIGLVFMFLDSRTRRLGDMAGGTLVVLERRRTDPSLSAASSATGEIDQELDPIVAHMTPEDYYFVVKFHARREGLDAEPRKDVAKAIGARIYGRIGRTLPPIGELEAILERLETAYRNKVRIL